MSSGGFFKRNWAVIVGAFIGTFIAQIWFIPYMNKRFNEKPSEPSAVVQYQPINASEFEELYSPGKNVSITARLNVAYHQALDPSGRTDLLVYIQTDDAKVRGYAPWYCPGAEEMEKVLSDNEGQQVRVDGEMRLCEELMSRDGTVPAKKYHCLRIDCAHIGQTVFDVMRCQ